MIYRERLKQVALAVQPFPHVMLLVNTDKGLEQFLPGHTIPPQKVQLAVDGHGNGSAKGLFQHVNLSYYVFICSYDGRSSGWFTRIHFSTSSRSIFARLSISFASISETAPARS